VLEFLARFRQLAVGGQALVVGEILSRLRDERVLCLRGLPLVCPRSDSGLTLV
jgi:hypothetical protein